MKKKALSLLLALIMVLSLVPVSAFGAEENTSLIKTSSISGSMSNPLYHHEEQTISGWKKAENMLSQVSGSAAAETVKMYERDLDKVAAQITEAMVARKTSIPVKFAIYKSDLPSEEYLETYLQALFIAAMGHNGVANQGDYLLWNYSQVSYGGDIYEYSYYYDLEITYTVSYYTTAKQETAVTKKVNEIIDGFGFTEETDSYTAVKAVYDYICDNVVYDTANVNNDKNTIKYTAYAALINGKAVCQGYAALLYRMLLELGVDCRIITGDSDGDGVSDHAWNIAGMGLLYYNCDATWDAGLTEYEWFLRCPDNFDNHVRDALYDLQEFHDAYPMAESDYVYGEEVVVGEGTCGEGVNWKLNAEGILTVSGEGAMKDYEESETRPWHEWSEYILGAVIEGGVTHVGNYAFYGCENLLAVELCEGVEEIGESAFSGDKNLLAIAIPSTLKKSGPKAFSGSEALKSVVISDLKAWCGIEYALGFGEYIATSMPMHSGTQLYLGEEAITDLALPAEVTAIAPYAFYNVSLNSVTMHDGVTELGTYAFYNTRMKELTLSGGLENISDRAFELHDMATVVIPEGVKTIGEFAFRRVNSNGAAGLDRSMDAIYLPATLERLDREALDSKNLYITDLAAWCGVTRSISSFNDTRYPYLYLNGQKVTDLVIPEGVSRIEAYAFYEFTGILSLTLPDSLEYIGPCAFQDLGISEIHWGSGLKHIDNHAFDRCSGLTEVIFPASLEKIGNGAFSQAKNLRRIVFTGHAPETYGSAAGGPFHGRTATASYPCSDDTWTEEAREALGKFATLTWVSDHVDCEIIPAVPATCTATGLTEGKKCTLCGEVTVAQQPTAMIPHTPVDGICSVCGEETVFFTQQPQNVIVKSGKTAKVTVAAEGEGLTYAWYWAPAGSDDFQLTTSFKSTSYSVTMNESRDGRQVFCRVTDKFGSFVDSDIVTLSMAKPPVITRELTYGYAKKGEEIVVDFEATGNGELTYTWYYANAGSSTYKKTTSFTGPEYSVEMSDSRAGRKVYCVVTDAFGLSTKTKTATLRMELEIVNDLADASAVSGKKASVTVKANGQGLKYEWYYSDGGAFKKTTSFTGPTYSLSMNEARDGRQVYCRITDKYGNSVETAKATLTMVPPPQIVVEPTYAYAKKGEEAVVSFEATGTGELTYEWYWAKAGSSTYKKTTSFTGPEYKTVMDDSRAGRKVYCVVTDETGASVKTKTVTLRMELEITEDLADVAVELGEKAAVTVKANGQGLKYEWFYADNGGEFKKTTSFKTATYSITMNEARAGRQVFCRITDKYGNMVQTATATLGMN